MWEKALEISSRMHHPSQVVAFALVFAALAFSRALKAKKPRMAWSLAIGIILLGISPLAASTFLAHQGLYRVRIIVLGTDEQPVKEAEISSSIGGGVMEAHSNWEFDLSPQTTPADRKVTFFASVKDAYLGGHSTLELAGDYYPTVSIRLQPLPTATVWGVVVDPSGKSVAGAQVSISGYSDVVTTDTMGNFALSAHAAEGQFVSVRAAKGASVAELSVIAGKNAELVLRKP